MLALPLTELPRERLLQHGAGALSVSELLAILLVTGTKDKSVLRLADEVLTMFGSLDRLIEASIEELTEIKGIGRAKAIQLQAAFAIALRSKKNHLSERYKVETPKKAFDLAKQEIGDCKQEVLLVILRDIKTHLIHCEKVSVGTLSEVLVHPREVFHPAVRHKAHSLILAHNHPSGDPRPSRADLELTRHLLQSSYVMGIGLADHLIVGSNSFVSLRERGLLGDCRRY
jgi:DNA repair protein RadC